MDKKVSAPQSQQFSLLLKQAATAAPEPSTTTIGIVLSPNSYIFDQCCSWSLFDLSCYLTIGSSSLRQKAGPAKSMANAAGDAYRSQSPIFCIQGIISLYEQVRISKGYIVHAEQLLTRFLKYYCIYVQVVVSIYLLVLYLQVIVLIVLRPLFILVKLFLLFLLGDVALFYRWILQFLIGLVNESINDVVQVIDLFLGLLLQFLEYLHFILGDVFSRDNSLVRLRQHLFAFLIQLVEFGSFLLLLKLLGQLLQLLLLDYSLCPCLYRLCSHHYLSLRHPLLCSLHHHHFLLFLWHFWNRLSFFRLFLLCLFSSLRLLNCLPVPLLNQLGILLCQLCF